MAASFVIDTRDVNHTHMLVKCIFNETDYYRIYEPCQVFKSMKQGEMYYTYLEHRRASCEIITSSDNLAELKEEMINIRAQNASKNTRQNYNAASMRMLGANPLLVNLGDDDNRMYTFGPYGTAITAKEMKMIDWGNYRSAIRSLLNLVFTPDTLATHSLLGNNRYKLTLEKTKVRDIFYIVTFKCGTSDENIRDVIDQVCYEQAMQRKNKNILKNKND